MPRLSHNNPAVLLSAVKVLVKNIDYISDEGVRQAMVKKLAAPLISLLSCEAELQYVSLRNISFILQKQPQIFENNIKVFYCKFNDPVYVKLEKIDILVKVADKNNCDQILQELKEYSNDVDMELVGASVKAIG
jgi:AP-1 complex subunit beta-1